MTQTCAATAIIYSHFFVFQRLAVDGYMSLVASLIDEEVVSEDVQCVLVTALSNNDALLRHTALRAMDTLTHHVLVDNPAIMAALLVASHDKEDNNNTLANKSVQFCFSNLLSVNFL